MKVKRQRGLVLLLCLVLTLMLGMLGVSVMGSATQQARMARNLLASLQVFEQAQQGLLLAEARVQEQAWPPCSFCLPPPEAGHVVAAGIHAGAGASSGLDWQAGEKGFYLIQFLGQSNRVRLMPPGQDTNLYRITAVHRQGAARNVLESVVAQPVAGGQWQRIVWRQLH
ncbi:hypothetical protein M2D63_019075 [Pseudomonas sp. BJa5]|uniref:pilus assembly PilX family protein n=1 Tax=Pseudomonas sp. BJa5 TaxID=2936270 RepID=UPI00255A0B15|nr:hypothetical protein [Pseudomonas sp. BGr12]MDL2423217.1 hypothetical protein [Pseudomonas sp. BGr12]